MKQAENIWIIDDDQSIRWVLEKALSDAKYQVKSFHNADAALLALANQEPKVIISDVRMPGTGGMDFLAAMQRDYAHIPIIIITAHSDLESTVSAYEGGAFEYLPKPFDIDDAVALVKRACAAVRSVHSPSPCENRDSETEIIGETPAMQNVFRAIGRLSRSNITVMINGESGTGKELVAHALHRHSPRAKAPFVALNMAAIPRDLLESELFGHEKGAFTGASSARKGRFEQAHGGTLFLDEIGDMPAELQTRLLRVLSEGSFYRVGGVAPVNVDVRIIAATHQNLSIQVKQGQFREDLFHRLNVVRIHLPALRERREDVPLLMDYFLKKSALELNEERKSMSPELVAWLTAQPWPGNVRQLQNLSRWLTVMAASRETQISDLPAELLDTSEPSNASPSWQDSLKKWAQDGLLRGQKDSLSQVLPICERILIQVALQHTQGHKQNAAKLLGWGRNTLTRKLSALGLEH